MQAFGVDNSIKSLKCQAACTYFLQSLASLSVLTLTPRLLRQVTQASQAPAAAPAMLKSEGVDKQKPSGHKGKEPQAAAQVAPRQTHAQLMSQMRQADEPLSVGGKDFLHVAAVQWKHPASMLFVVSYDIKLFDMLSVEL